MISGKILAGWGHAPGKNTRELMRLANQMQGRGMTIPEVSAHFQYCADRSDDQIMQYLQPLVPLEMLGRTSALPYADFLRMTDAAFPEEMANVKGVHEHMDILMRLPPVVAGAIMPDAMPVSRVPGTIPVGGVISAKEAIFPDMHSADICCSMAMTIFGRNDDPKHVMDIAQNITHFGPIKISKSRNTPVRVTDALLEKMANNRFLKSLIPHAKGAFMTQGDGNHFLSVGQLESTGMMVMVTHHGSRSLGAMLHRMGMAAAIKHTSIVSPRTNAHNSWIDSETDIGRDYWEALQLVREWTKQNHFALHNTVAKALGNAVAYQTWNEHNFVFRKSDGLFYHAKGATPSYQGYSEDDDGTCIIPMNMAEPMLIVAHGNRKKALEFAPHGAGRDMSRTQYMKTREIVYPENIDYRFYCGNPDPSELPGSYKSAALIEKVIREEKLANIMDRVIPYGSIMAGEHDKDAHWKVKRTTKNAAKIAAEEAASGN